MGGSGGAWGGQGEGGGGQARRGVCVCVREHAAGGSNGCMRLKRDSYLLILVSLQPVKLVGEVNASQGYERS